MLTRIDRLRDNFCSLLAYLTLLGFLIVLTGVWGTQEATVEDLPPDAPFFMKWVAGPMPRWPFSSRWRPFSAYAIFYSKSATFAGTPSFFASWWRSLW